MGNANSTELDPDDDFASPVSDPRKREDGVSGDTPGREFQQLDGNCVQEPHHSGHDSFAKPALSSRQTASGAHGPKGGMKRKFSGSDSLESSPAKRQVPRNHHINSSKSDAATDLVHGRKRPLIDRYDSRVTPKQDVFRGYSTHRSPSTASEYSATPSSGRQQKHGASSPRVQKFQGRDQFSVSSEGLEGQIHSSKRTWRNSSPPQNEKQPALDEHASHATADSLDWSIVPKGPRRAKAPPVIAEVPVSIDPSALQCPHIFISDRFVQVLPTSVSHLEGLLRKTAPKLTKISIDQSGYYVLFPRNDSGREECLRCYAKYDDTHFFRTYRLKMELFAEGVDPERCRARRPRRLSGQIRNESSSPPGTRNYDSRRAVEDENTSPDATRMSPRSPSPSPSPTSTRYHEIPTTSQAFASDGRIRKRVSGYRSRIPLSKLESEPGRTGQPLDVSRIDTASYEQTNKTSEGPRLAGRETKDEQRKSWSETLERPQTRPVQASPQSRVTRGAAAGSLSQAGNSSGGREDLATALSRSDPAARKDEANNSADADRSLPQEQLRRSSRAPIQLKEFLRRQASQGSGLTTALTIQTSPSNSVHDSSTIGQRGTTQNLPLTLASLRRSPKKSPSVHSQRSTPGQSDDTMSVSSGVSPSDVSSRRSTSSTRRCDGCSAKETPWNALRRCSACRRKFHDACQKPRPVEGEEATWKCYRCISNELRGTKASSSKEASSASSKVKEAPSSIAQSSRGSLTLSTKSCMDQGEIVERVALNSPETASFPVAPSVSGATAAAARSKTLLSNVIPTPYTRQVPTTRPLRSPEHSSEASRNLSRSAYVNTSSNSSQRKSTDSVSSHSNAPTPDTSAADDCSITSPLLPSGGPEKVLSNNGTAINSNKASRFSQYYHEVSQPSQSQSTKPANVDETLQQETSESTQKRQHSPSDQLQEVSGSANRGSLWPAQKKRRFAFEKAQAPEARILQRTETTNANFLNHTSSRQSESSEIFDSIETRPDSINSATNKSSPDVNLGNTRAITSMAETTKDLANISASLAADGDVATDANYKPLPSFSITDKGLVPLFEQGAESSSALSSPPESVYSPSPEQDTSDDSESVDGARPPRTDYTHVTAKAGLKTLRTSLSHTMNSSLTGEAARKLTYNELIGMALLEAPADGFTARDITDWITRYYWDDYPPNEDKWKASVAAILCQKDYFQKLDKVAGQRSCKWTLAYRQWNRYRDLRSEAGIPNKQDGGSSIGREAGAEASSDSDSTSDLDGTRRSSYISKAQGPHNVEQSEGSAVETIRSPLERNNSAEKPPRRDSVRSLSNTSHPKSSTTLPNSHPERSVLILKLDFLKATGTSSTTVAKESTPPASTPIAKRKSSLETKQPQRTELEIWTAVEAAIASNSTYDVDIFDARPELREENLFYDYEAKLAEIRARPKRKETFGKIVAYSRNSTGTGPAKNSFNAAHIPLGRKIDKGKGKARPVINFGDSDDDDDAGPWLIAVQDNKLGVRNARTGVFVPK